jgi:4-amino-4-deoxy-L-arabinose transferase-like glycosyltransferase
VRLWLSALAIWALGFGITTRTTLWDRDEPRFARAALEMARTGDWVVPRFEGAPRTAKPPLTYWLMAVSMKIGGPGAFAARFWSPLALALAGLFTGLLGRRLGSSEVGARAMWMTTLAALPLVEGTAATADAILLAAITGSLLAGVALIQHPCSLWPVPGLVAALAVGLLTKGPAGLLVPLAVIALLSLRHGNRIATRRTLLVLVASAGLSLTVFATWAVLASRATEGRFISEFIRREVVGRALAPREGHGVPWFVAPLFYPVALAIGFLPWSIYLPGALRRARDRWPEGDLLTTFAVIGVTVPIALFTLAATKLPHYVLPAFPPLAVLCAAASLSPRAPGAPDRFDALLVGTIATVLLVAAIALPLIEHRKAIPRAVSVANAACPVDCDVSVAGVDEPSLIFLLDRAHVTRLDSAGAIESWLRSSAPGVLVARSDRWDTQTDASRRSGRELARVRGMDVVHGGEMTLVVVSRGPH